MKYASSSSNIDSELLRVLLTPSWLSGTIAVSVSLVITLGTMLLSSYETSSIRLDFLHYQAGQIINTYRSVNDYLSSNIIIGNLPLLIFWSLVGLVVYLFVSNIFAAIYNTAELTSELHYVNVQRRKLIWTAVMHLIIRFIVLTVWILYILFFMHHIIPYCIAAALAGSAHFSAFQSIGYVVLSVVVMIIALHLNAVLLRLLLMRPRVFSNALYVD